MATQTTQPSPLQRAAEMNEVLRVWAQAIGCPVNQVTDVVAARPACRWKSCGIR